MRLKSNQTFYAKSRFRDSSVESTPPVRTAPVATDMLVMPSLTFYLHLLFVTLIFLSNPAVARAFVARVGQCEPIKLERCQVMPYNMTQMPNLLHHNTQQNAALLFQHLEPLLDSQCSDVLRFFLCAIYVPICHESLQQREAIPPCRDVCERAKLGCESLLRQFNISWNTSIFECSRLPWYERGFCVKPEAFVQKSTKTNQPQPKTSTSSRGGTDLSKTKPTRKELIRRCSCKKRRPSWRRFRKYDFQYAIKGTIRKRKRNRKGQSVFLVKVNKVLFSGKVTIEEGTVAKIIYITSHCDCARLRRGRSYLLMGQEDRKNEKLYISHSSGMAKWREEFTRRVGKWHQRLEKRRKRLAARKRNKMTLSNEFGLDAQRNVQTSDSSSSGDVRESSRTHPLGNPSKDGGKQKGSRNKKYGNDRDTKSRSENSGSPASTLPEETRQNQEHGGKTFTRLDWSDLQEGTRHGGRYYSKELAQLHSYELSSLKDSNQ